MSSIYDWSITAASNANSDTGINWNEGQAPSTVNNSARAMMGRFAEFVKDQGGTLVAGGMPNALTLTANSAFVSYASGLIVAFKAAADNTGAATLSVNSIGAKSIRKFTSAGEVALDAGNIKQSNVYSVRYSAAANSGIGAWILDDPTLPGVGTYTPAIVYSGTSDTFGSPNAFYMRTGSLIQVFGSFTVNASAVVPPVTGTLAFRMSLPIASNLATTLDLHGTFSSVQSSGVIAGAPSTDDASCSTMLTSSAAATHQFMFAYKIL